MQKKLSPPQKPFYEETPQPFYEETPQPPPKKTNNKRQLELESMSDANRKRIFEDLGLDNYKKYDIKTQVKMILEQEEIVERLGAAFPSVPEQTSKYKIGDEPSDQEKYEYLVQKISGLNKNEIYERMAYLYGGDKKTGFVGYTGKITALDANGKERETTFETDRSSKGTYRFISESTFMNKFNKPDDIVYLRNVLIQQEFAAAESYEGLKKYVDSRTGYAYHPERDAKYPKQGFGMKKKKGKGDLVHIDIGSHIGKNYKEGKGSHQPYIKSRIKIGAGVVVAEKEPTYQEFGKFVIHIPQLRKNILNFKYASGSRPQYLPIVNIDDDTKDLLVSTLETGRMSENQFNKLPQPSKDFLIKAIKGAGLQDTLFKGKDKLYATEEKEDRDRFNILKGEFDAGNDNQNLIKELRGLVIKFIDTRIIPKKQGLEFLRQLN